MAGVGSHQCQVGVAGVGSHHCQDGMAGVGSHHCQVEGNPSDQESGTLADWEGNQVVLAGDILP